MYRNSVLALTGWQQILYKQAAKIRNSFIIYSLIFLVTYMASNAILAIKLNIILTSCHVIIKQIMQRLNDNSSIVQLLVPKINTLKTLKLINIFCNRLNINNANTVIILAAIIRKNPALAAVVDNDGGTALHWAAELGLTEIALLLIRVNPALATAVGGSGMTVLHLAVKLGQTEVALALISANPALAAVVNRYDKDRALLRLSIELGQTEVALALIGANPALAAFVNGGLRRTVLHLAIESRRTKIALALISANPALAAILDTGGGTALHWAVDYGQTEVVLALISANPALAAVKDNGGRTALNLAIRVGRTETALALIGASPALAAVKDDNRRTALHLAVIREQTEVALALISVNPELSAVVDFMGWTALHLAAEHGQTEIALALIHANTALASVADGEGRTALHVAVMYEQAEVALALISVNPELAAVVDNNGSTALHLAAMYGQTEIALALIHANTALAAVVSDAGRTALHVAVMYEQAEVAAVLTAITNNITKLNLSSFKITTMNIAVQLINILKMDKNLVLCTFNLDINTQIKDYLDCEMDKIYQRNNKYADKCMADILLSVIRSVTDDGTYIFCPGFTPTASQYQYLTKAHALIKYKLMNALGSEAAADKILKDINANFAQAFSYAVGICITRDTSFSTAMSVPGVSSNIAGFLGKDELERLRLLAMQKPAAAIIASSARDDIRGEELDALLGARKRSRG